MNLSEVASSFKSCTGEAHRSFKDYLISLSISKEDIEKGIVISDCANYILRDIELLLSKAIINLCAADLLIKRGYFHWGFVTSYYSSFYSVQALNRLMLNFYTWTKSGVICKVTNYAKQELSIMYSNSSGGSHEAQFEKFYENYSAFKHKKSIDRYWTIGLRNFKHRPETVLRNDINYSIEKEYYYELTLDERTFRRIIGDNKTCLPGEQLIIKTPINYSLPHLELSLSRIRITLYILNYIANAQPIYYGYYVHRNNERKQNIDLKYPHLSQWIKDRLYEWLQFVEHETDDILV